MRARVGAVPTIVAVLCLSAPVVGAAETPLVVFDLSDEEASIEERTARMLWNLVTDNVDRVQHPYLDESWNSSYLVESDLSKERPSGRISLDLEAGTISGNIIERWSCDHDCTTSIGTPSYMTTLDTGWEARIEEGRLEPDAEGWRVDGKVSVTYDATVTSDESPSDCGGTPCWICKEKVCRFAETTTQSDIALSGWLRGETLRLEFVDRLEADVDNQDFSDVRVTQFFMTRYSIEITGPVSAQNRAPEVSQIAASPSEPDSEDTLVFSVTATDPDGDDLTYTWFFDGVIEPASGPQASWRKPSPGDHEIEVDVTDGIETIERFADIRVSEAVGAGDQDDDGVPDDEDLCPTEWGEGDDGCPPFAVAVGCAPARPFPDDTVSCSASATGVRIGETAVYDWYLDGRNVQSGSGSSWTWTKSTEGRHEVVVDATGEGRMASARWGFEVTGGLVDEETAGFSIERMVCSSDISTEETLSCSATLKREKEEIGALAVTWRIDGGIAKQENAAGNTSSWTLNQPAPGDHIVQILVVDPVTNLAQASSALAGVRPGRNAAIPPGVQAMAAGLSTLTIGGWLWLEYLRRMREAALAAPPPPRTDIPDWVFDKRPLAEIWADEAAAEAARRNLNPQEWWRNPVTGDYVHAKVLEAEVDRLEQAALKDEWRRYVDVFGTYKGSEEVGTFIKQNESNVWRGDRIDPDQMERLRRAIERLRRAETGFRKVPEYTSKQQLLDYMGSLSQSTGARIVLALGTAGKSEMLLAPWAMHQRMVDRVRAGWTQEQIDDATIREFWNDVIMYAGGTAVVGLGAPSIGAAAVRGTGQVAQRLLPTAWTKALTRAGKAIYKTATRPIGPDLGEMARKGARRVVEAATGWNESLRRAADRTMKLAGKAYEFGSQPIGSALTQVKKSWELSRRGVSDAWNKAGDYARLANLRSVNAQLADALEDLTRRIDDTGGAATKDVPSLAFTGQDQKHLWKITDDMFRLTPDEFAAAQLLQEMPDAYQAAVRNGLVPVRTHQLVNHTRDKILKHAMVRAYRKVPEYVRKGLQRIEITGTGANPRSPRAGRGWTDFDCQTLGAQNSEEAFVRAWQSEVRRGASEVGMPGYRLPDQLRSQLNQLNDLDANMFVGLRPDAPAAGYRDENLLRWVDVDGKFSGKAISPTKKGNLVIGYRADAPMGVVQGVNKNHPSLWGLESPPRMPFVEPGTPAARSVLGEVQRKILEHPATSLIDNLRVNGKHALRSWKLQTVGHGVGGAVDPGIRVLEMMKANRQWMPSPDQLRQAAQAFERWTGMSAGV